MTTRPRYDAARAVAHALAMVGRGVYRLGAGDIDSDSDGERDCFGFAYCECYGVRRHRPGFNTGAWATVSDDLNCNSAIEDADHARDLFVRAERPRAGDLLTYPTIRLPGRPYSWIGHVAIVVSVARAGELDMAKPDWSLLDVVQCHGPNGFRPAIVATTGGGWNMHDATWPKPQHRTVLLRPLA